METDKNYFRVGAFVLVILFAGLGFTLWLTSAGKGETVDYRIRFAESVGGLKIGNTVKFRGVDVGEVRKMEIDPDDIRMIRVGIRVLKTTPVKTDTLASLKLQDISGDLYVELTGSDKDAPDLAAKGDGLPEIRSEKSALATLMNRLPQILDKSNELLEKANHIASQIGKIFSDENVAEVNAIIKKLADYVGANKKDTGDKRAKE
jgi:phospholipid/cholesterol/gamma-HCH transport system substrate-binding protein